MPKADCQHMTHFVLTLELSPNELDRLRSMMQNPLNGNTPDTEPSDERAIRRAIFDACAKHRT
jgi:hypothetical protein